MREQLISLLGTRAATKLMRCFGGRHVRVPVPEDEQRRKLRNRRVLTALACQCGDPTHHSYRAVARRFHVSPRTVIRIGKSA